MEVASMVFGLDCERRLEMSSRWKKKRRSKPVARKTGGEPKWMTLGKFSSLNEHGELSMAVQQSCCKVSGEVFVRAITGRFKDLPSGQLAKMVDELLQVFVRAGYPPELDPGQPLWMQAEFLDNLMEFELDPPCGCESELRQVIRTA